MDIKKKTKKQGQFRFASRLVVTAGSMFWKTLGWSANWHNAFRRFARNNYRRLHNGSACLSIFFPSVFSLVLHAAVIFPMIFFFYLVFCSLFRCFLPPPPLRFFCLAYSHGNRCSETSTVIIVIMYS